ncbi:MAG: chromosome segregation protein SMC [Myxococcota bacterium]|nr:chromosome segregation protein SMC [Myxococcota bacterium]
MKLKRLDIHGFKSFYHRTTVVFDEGITGIVGPNGCGKSNIVDALKWVMGEQGAKSLRGASMEDVIFNGSGQRGPMGLCEVSLTFHNDGKSEVPQRWRDVPEIAIRRRLERSKGSDYSVNQQRCRLADVQDLLSGTGVASGPGGRRAYAIIEQGQISKIVSAKADERRLLIEEAAGISRYRQRRQLAERKMLSTEQNLERVDDIVAEVERQMRSLRRQAKKAERFREYRDEARQIAVLVSLFDYLELKRAIEEQNSQVESLLNAEKDTIVAVQTAEANRLAVQTQERDTALKVSGTSERLRRIEETVLVARERIAGYARERDMLHAQLDQAQRDLAAGEGRRSELELELEETAARCGQLEVEADEFKSLVAQRVDAHKSAARRVIEARADLEGYVRKEAQEIQVIARARADLEMGVRMQRELAVRRERLAQQNQGQRQRLAGHMETVSECEARLKNARDAEKTAEAQLQAASATAQKCRDALDEGVEKERDLRDQLVTKTSRHDSLLELERRRDDLSEGCKSVLDAGLEECLGPISGLWDVPQEYEAATQSALSINMDAVVMGSQTAKRAAISFASEMKTPKVLLAQLETNAFSRTTQIPKGASVVGYLVDLINPEKGRDLLAYCISDALLVESVEDALDVLEKGFSGSVVTLGGDRFLADAIACVGRSGDDVGPIQRRREIKQLAGEIEALKTAYDALKTALDEARQTVETSRRALDDARAQARTTAIVRAEQQKEFEQLERQRILLAQASERFELDMAEIERQLETNQLLEQDAKGRLRDAESNRGDHQRTIRDAEEVVAQREQIRDQALGDMHDAKARANTVGERLIGMRTLVSRLERQISEIQVRRERVVSVGGDVERRLAELQLLVDADKTQCALDEESAAQLASELAGIKAEHETLREKVLEVDESLENTRGKRDQLRTRLADGKLELESIKLRADNIALRMKERYQVELASAVENMEGLERPGPESVVRLEELEMLLEKMGDVNVSAIDEFEAVAERFEFLTTQRDDLLSALGDLEAAIKEIDQTTKALFVETFEAVRGHFRDLFPRLFRGGEADLELTHPDDLLATGINMNVSPPGKKIQSVELLSGGEKAMCAIALIFAVFRHRPSPFCLLDEVDAPLDDANIGRFNDVVREIAQRSQVILVTHNKRTMEIADSLYGVTMEESGVSKLVGVRMS